jgi:hypothetical protein
MVISKTDLGIDEEDIQISMELKMLIAIIQEHPSNIEPLKSQLPVGKSILSDKDGNSLEGLGHLKRLIACLLW